jgi:hypothetical protein
MAIAELTDHLAPDAPGTSSVLAGQVRLGVHDASRLEWSLSIPLPEDAALPYGLDVEIQIPQNAFVRHTPWDQMQGFTRLDGPAFALANDAISIDQLRRGALAMANQLARAGGGFARHCRLAGSLFATTSHSELEEALLVWIDAALRVATETREFLVTPVAGEPAEVRRERALVDEYVSVRLLEMLAGAERAATSLAASRTPHAERLAPVLEVVEDRIADVLGIELAHRAERSYATAEPSSPDLLERYLDRASRLKKHFQEVLFLETESFQVAERAYHWVAGFVALLASTWAFAWQFALASRSTSTGQTVGSGLVTLALVAGLVYATKDRIKEVGRNWVTRRLQRLYGAQRITRYRAPARRLTGRDAIVTARETLEQVTKKVPDPLNPECGAMQALTVIRYEHRGTVVPHKELVASGVRRVKHVFRYDLSPMFARLDDALKKIPVLDETTRRVRFVDAPRCYRIPIEVRVTIGGEKHVETAVLVVHKRGLDRLERAVDSDPALPDMGVEPG